MLELSKQVVEVSKKIDALDVFIATYSESLTPDQLEKALSLLTEYSQALTPSQKDEIALTFEEEGITPAIATLESYLTPLDVLKYSLLSGGIAVTIFVVLLLVMTVTMDPSVSRAITVPMYSAH